MKAEICLEGKTALVTGGGTGIGYGIAKELRDMGARVIIAGRRLDVLKSAAETLDATPFAMDISNRDSIAQRVEALYAQCGELDVLVNNAGVQDNRDALDFDEAAMNRLFDTNVFGTYALTREVAGRMLTRGQGSIVFITSSAVHMGLKRNLGYSATKGALASMARAFASELSPKGIRVNAVVPGWIETELVRESMRLVPERRALVEHRAMLERFGTPQDVGMAVAFLASDAARYITAAELRVDGGVAVSL